MFDSPLVLTNHNWSGEADPRTLTKRSDMDGPDHDRPDFLTPCYPMNGYGRERETELRESGYVHSNVTPGSPFYCEVSSVSGLDGSLKSGTQAQASIRYAQLRGTRDKNPKYVSKQQKAIDKYWDNVAKEESKCAETVQTSAPTISPKKSRQKRLVKA